MLKYKNMLNLMLFYMRPARIAKNNDLEFNIGINITDGFRRQMGNNIFPAESGGRSLSKVRTRRCWTDSVEKNMC